jgi:hypothetical protein
VKTLRSVPFLLGLLACPPLASANEQCHDLPFPSTTTNWMASGTVPQFNPSLGILTGITLNFSGRVQGGLGFESLDAQPTTVTSTYAAQVGLADAAFTPLVVLNPSVGFVDNVTAFDGVIDFGGTSGVTHPNLDIMDGQALVLPLSPANLATFVGAGTVTFNAAASGNSVVLGPGNVISQFMTMAGANVRICYQFLPDCDGDGISDADEIAAGAPDRYGPGTCIPDGVPDVCQPEPDCDGDGLPDRCERGYTDCNQDGIPDQCQPDCDGDGIADVCEILGGAFDLYGPGTCVPDGVPDVCQPEADCDNDGFPDRCEIAAGAPDADQNGVPDNCQPDCDNDGILDVIEIQQGAPDLYGPMTCTPDGIPDSCQPELDCDNDGFPDRCELANNDCDANGVPDNCQPDCDADGIPDACEILGGAPDVYGPMACMPDGIPDVCQMLPDCDSDGVPDLCEIDSDGNGVPDDCEVGRFEGCTPGYWKNHLSAWATTGYSPAMDFDTVFGVDAFTPNRTLYVALRSGGGGVDALGRHAVSALLNSAHASVSYPLSAADVITLVQNALATGDIEATKNLLASYNEAGCPL